MDIFYEFFKVGSIADNGELSFVYDDGWVSRTAAFPISLSMPFEPREHPREIILPWLANLLPETHLSEIGQQFKVSPQDVLGILKHLGRDTAGALSVGLPRKPGMNYREIPSAKAMERILNELPSKPFLMGEHGVSMSLAGVQEKLPVVLEGGKYAIPVDGTPSTHILKPDTPRLAGSVQNEAFCLTLARLCGLEAAEVSTDRAGSRNFLVVKRYDRIADRKGVTRRLHQEDFCQILGLFPTRKYEKGSEFGEPGPGLSQLFDAVRTYINPGERLRLLDAVIFNVLACNTDSHAKNYSVQIGAGGSAKLAPLYDILCAKIYPKIDQSLPQRIGSKSNGDILHGSDWQAMAKAAGLNPSATLRRVAELCSLVTERADEAKRIVEEMPAGGCEILSNVVHEVKKRCRKIERQLAQRNAAYEKVIDEARGPRR